MKTMDGLIAERDELEAQVERLRRVGNAAFDTVNYAETIGELEAREMALFDALNDLAPGDIDRAKTPNPIKPSTD